MRRSLNVRFLVGLVVVCLLVGAGLFFLYRFQDQRLADDLLELAETAQGAGRVEDAVRCFKRYLRARPADDQTVARYAVLLDAQAGSPEAQAQTLTLLAKVVAALPDRHDIRERLARRAMELGAFAAAAKHLEVLVKLRPNDVDLLVLLARCALVTGQYGDAALWLERVIQNAPQRVESHLQLAAVHDRLGHAQRVAEVLDAMVEANPASPQAYLARARHRQQSNPLERDPAETARTLERAAADVARALELAPADGDVLLTAAEIAYAQGQYDHARDLLDKCFTPPPKQAAPYLLRARLERRAGRLPEAVAALRQGLATLPEADHDTLRLRLLDLLVQDRRLAEARTTLQQLRKGKTPSLPLDFLEARLLVQEGKWFKAALTVERLSKLTAPEDVALAEQLRHVAAEPDQFRHHLALGLNLWRSKEGASPEAENCLDRAFALSNGAPEALTAYVQYLVEVKKKDKAETLVERARQEPALADAVLPLVLCYELLDRLDQAEQVFDTALADEFPNPAFLRAAAEFHVRHNQFAKAEPQLRRLLDPEIPAGVPDRRWARRVLAIGLALRRENPAFQEALALLDENIGSGSEDRRARAIVLAQQPMHRGEAIGLLEALLKERTISALDLFILVQLHEANRDWTMARQRLSVLLGSPAGKTPTTLAYAVQAELKHGSADEAQAHFAELAKLQPGAFGTLVLEARLAKARGNTGAAADLIQKLARRDGADLGLLAALLEEFEQIEAADALFRANVNAGKEARAVLARARFLGRQRRLAEALDLCEQAWKTCDPAEVANTAVALARADQASAAQRARVEKWLQTALAKDSSSVPLLLALADVHDMRGRSSEAIKVYRQVLEHEANNMLAQNNLAWMLARQAGQADAALEVINKAIKVHGPAPHLLGTRALALMAAGKGGAAVRDLELATTVDPSAVHYFHLAQAYVLVGQRENALQALCDAEAANLTLQQLHVSERPAYEKLLKDLDLH